MVGGVNNTNEEDDCKCMTKTDDADCRKKERERGKEEGG